MKHLLALFLLAPLAAGAVPGFETAGLRFFEQSDAAVLPVERRTYATRFDATRLRRLGVDFSATYAAPEGDAVVPLACTMTRPDGSAVPAERPMEFRFFTGKTASQSANLLWGMPGGADWPAGHYAVECLADGKSVARASFEVLLSPPEVEDGELRVKAIRLFAVEELLPPIAERRYALAFASDQTRRIGVELEFAHAPIGHAAKVPVDCWFFWPDGQTSPPLVLSYEPEPAWAGGFSAAAMGFAEPGGWNKGVYTVNCAIAGQPVAVERFDVK